MITYIKNKPYTLAKVIFKNEDNILFKIEEYKTPLNLDLEPITYNSKEDIIKILKENEFVFINTECWGSNDYKLTNDIIKKIEFNKFGGVILFQGEVTIIEYKDDKEFWIDCGIPINFKNIVKNINIPKNKDFIIKKEAGGLRAGSILTLDQSKIKITQEQKNKLR